MNISATQSDALGEMMNIAVGRAARSLGALIDKAVQLEAPQVYVVAPQEAGDLLRCITSSAEAVTISQDFSGSVAGRVGMYFTLEGASALLQTLWGQPSQDPKSFSLEEQAVLEEIANIMLNGAVSAIADLLDEIIQLSLPTVIMSDASSGYAKWIAKGIDPAESAFVVVAANMLVEDLTIQSLIVLSLAVHQIRELLGKLG